MCSFGAFADAVSVTRSLRNAATLALSLMWEKGHGQLLRFVAAIFQK